MTARSRLLLSAALVAAGLSSARAVTTRTWRVTTWHDFDEGETSGVLLSSLGEADAGFTATRIDVTPPEVYASAIAPDGSVWLGTGDQAELWRFDGKTASKVARLSTGSEGVLVSSLAIAPDGVVYAGALPGGHVWRVDKGVAKELCKLEGAEHVWALVLLGRTLYAATGPNGRVFAIDPATGKSRVLWSSGEKHIMSLVADGKGGLFAGSAEEAILYRLGTDGSAKALHDFEGDEVRAIVPKGESIYLIVNELPKGTLPSGATPPPSTAKPHGTKMVLPPAATASVPSASAREKKGKGAVYRLDADGRVEQLHALAESYFTALHVTDALEVYAAAGANGRLYLVRPDHTVLTAFDFPERQILTLSLGGPHPLLGTGDAGALYTIEFAPPRDATYLTKVFDAGFPARWGAARWSGTGELAIETRAGNTARPDKTWSAWQSPAKITPSSTGIGSREGAIASPPGRYLQLRAGFGKSAVLRDVTLFFLPQNQRARVVEVTVGDDPGQRLAHVARIAGKPRSPVVKLKWKVENPDEDELVFRLFFREENELTWKPLGGSEPLTVKELDWNTETIPDGNYVLKVVASDERANPREDALDHALISTPFLIDNRKPEVAGLTVAYPFASGVARDSFSPISELAFSVDGGDWQPFAPRDGIFDAPIEDFSARLPAGLLPGSHTIAVRAVDGADNVGAAQTQFRVGAK